MRFRRLVLAAALLLLPQAAAAECHGFFNATEQGLKLEGDRLEPTGPKVAAGTEFEFTGIAQIRDKFYLTRSRSDIMYDAENVELTSGCNLPTVVPKSAR